MSVTGFLGRALMDPETGLPNKPYFSIVRSWEERRARRRGYAVRVVTVSVESADEALLRSIGWRLCQELRTSDLISSEGRNIFHILLTSPDAENAELIGERINELARALNVDHPQAALRFDVTLQTAALGQPEAGPCDPWDDTVDESDNP